MTTYITPYLKNLLQPSGYKHSYIFLLECYAKDCRNTYGHVYQIHKHETDKILREDPLPSFEYSKNSAIAILEKMPLKEQYRLSKIIPNFHFISTPKFDILDI